MRMSTNSGSTQAGCNEKEKNGGRACKPDSSGRSLFSTSYAESTRDVCHLRYLRYGWQESLHVYCTFFLCALLLIVASATPAQLTQIIRELAPQMKNRRNRPSAFLNIDLPDFIATHGYISVGEGGHQVLIEEYKRRVDARVLEIVEEHPVLAALREGREVTDEQLVDLERTLHRELGRDDIQLSSRNIRIAYGLRVDNFLAFLRHLLALDAIPDYAQLVQRGFERHIQAHNYNAEQIRFLRSVQEVFLAKRTLVEADLYDPPLTNFGRNAVERFFTPQEIGDLLHLTQSLAA